MSNFSDFLEKIFPKLQSGIEKQLQIIQPNTREDYESFVLNYLSYLEYILCHLHPEFTLMWINTSGFRELEHFHNKSLITLLEKIKVMPTSEALQCSKNEAERISKIIHQILHKCDV